MSDLHNLTGENPDQLLVLTDRSGNQIGTATRKDCHRNKGRPHLAFLAFILDRDKNIILARRSRSKSLWPSRWDATVVSHILPGESPAAAASRRGREEMGVSVRFRDIGAFYYFKKFNGSSENEYCHVLTGTTDRDVESNPVEIDSVKKIKFADLLKEIKISPDIFTPWLKIALEKTSLPSV